MTEQEENQLHLEEEIENLTHSNTQYRVRVNELMKENDALLKMATVKNTKAAQARNNDLEDPLRKSEFEINALMFGNTVEPSCLDDIHKILNQDVD